MYIQNDSYSIIMNNRTFLTEFVYFIYLFCTDFFCFLSFFCLLIFFSNLLFYIFLSFFLSFVHSSILSDLSNPPSKKIPSCPPWSRSISACLFPSTSLHHTATTSPCSLPLSHPFVISIARRRFPALVLTCLLADIWSRILFCLLPSHFSSPLLSSPLLNSPLFCPLLCSVPTIRSIAENESLLIQ